MIFVGVPETATAMLGALLQVVFSLCERSEPELLELLMEKMYAESVRNWAKINNRSFAFHHLNLTGVAYLPHQQI